MQPHILLSFGTHLGRTRTVRINNADRNVSDLTVTNTMNRLLGAQVLVTIAGGLANSKRRATLVETQVIPINIGS